MRPVGALVFGHIGDKWGRKTTFFLVLVIMGVATVVMGSLPTYAQAGVLSTIGLFITRLIQGFSIGGEIGGMATYIVENAPAGKRAYYTSIASGMITAGLFLATLTIYSTSAILGTSGLYSYGWRILFWIAAEIVVIGIIFRLFLQETPVYKDYAIQGKTLKSPIAAAFRKAGRAMLLIFLIDIALTVDWYFTHISNYTYMLTISKVPVNTALLAYTILLVIAPFMYVISGYLADKYGRKTMLKWIFTLTAITAFLIGYKFTVTNNIFILSIVSLIFLVFAAFSTASAFTSFDEIAPANVKYTAYSFPYHAGVGILGGFTPYITIWLILTLGTSIAGSLYPAIASVISAVVAWIWYPETRDIDIRKTV